MTPPVSIIILASGARALAISRRWRGDATGNSEAITDGVAHTLQLEDAERAHLVHLL